ncbi:uroporphyrinogen-III synthase [Oecophyllibacter saccharovorans]|uniref:uroporphyrinogen-III synthase n=1 Tax=Oecophyllibacter saccharovorans TaxID=2558360 RepID=UPI0011447DEB|nr:uroporphyrinogen-III synthase [Oecophyllibacter saccharovorans]QDH15706.1 uroporphyrinogen-III synthase [Oecophyllibacter saccharovorans]TPW36726.1 uroporphyrinogen-III synthase [Oecophyllibacter saccharovorans]
MKGAQSARQVVLVTRPEPGLSETLAQGRALGWAMLGAPGLEIIPSAPLPPLAAQALAITSAQALSALQNQPRDRLLLSVGEATGDRARAAGFVNVRSAGGTAGQLEGLCRELGLGGAHLVFACGRGRHGQAYGAEMARRLGAGWQETYRVRTLAALPADALQALAEGRVAAVMFCSTESAAAFFELCPPVLQDCFAAADCLCLSEAIARRAAEGVRWRKVMIASPVSALLHQLS